MPFRKDNHVIYDAITVERARQEWLRETGKFPATCATTGPEQLSESECVTVLGEEFGEVSRAVLEMNAYDKANPHENGRHALRDHLIEELIQNAAVCVAWVERLTEAERLEHAT